MSEIKIDLNRVTRREFREYLVRVKEADGIKADELTGALIEKIVISWPYDQPITQEGYLNLGLRDSQEVDEFISGAMSNISEKKLEPSSI